MLRLMTLNVGSLFEDGWDRRRHEIVAWIDQVDPDIVCVQEVWQDRNSTSTARWLVDHSSTEFEWVFGGHAPGWAAKSRPDLRFGSAILSRWPIEQSELTRLPIGPNPEDSYLTEMPWELLHARTAGLDVFTVHLAAAPSHGRHRQHQVVAVDEKIRAIRHGLDHVEVAGSDRAAMPPILCGDFNAEPGSDEIRFLRGFTQLDGRSTFWQDAWAVAGEGPGLTQDWTTHPLAAALNVHRKRIDYVFVGDPFLREGGGGRVESARVIADKPLTGVQASDHAGLVVEIAWPDRP